MNEDRFYLIVRDRLHGETSVTEYADGVVAAEAYGAAELENQADIFAEDPVLEIVLIAGESLEAVREMYPHYFTAGNRATRQRDLLAAL